MEDIKQPHFSNERWGFFISPDREVIHDAEIQIVPKFGKRSITGNPAGPGVSGMPPGIYSGSNGECPKHSFAGWGGPESPGELLNPEGRLNHTIGFRGALDPTG
jgi:hypothetical protein